MNQINANTLSFDATTLAFGLVKDLNVQVLTLATGLLGIAIIFTRDIIKKHSKAKAALEAVILLSYLTSLIAGLFSLMGLIGTLSMFQTPSLPTTSVFDFNIDRAIVPTPIQAISFGLGTLVLVAYVGFGLVELWGVRITSTDGPPKH